MAARLRKIGLPYLLLLPGLGFLAVFFAIPLGYTAFESLKRGTIETGYIFDWNFSNYTERDLRLLRAVSSLVRVRRDGQRSPLS